MIRLLIAAALLATFAAPAVARHRTHVTVHGLPRGAFGMSYLHNYGPGAAPGEIATYDGAIASNCKQGAAAYRGLDRRPHPCN
jgi:hypothetical protein